MSQKQPSDKRIRMLTCLSGNSTVAFLGQKYPSVMSIIRSCAVLSQHGAGKYDLSNALQENIKFRSSRHSWSGLLWTNFRSRWRRDIWATESRGKGVVLCFNVGFYPDLASRGRTGANASWASTAEYDNIDLVLWNSCWLLYNLL